MSKARELAELSRTVSDSADAVAITINSNEEVTFADDILLADGKKAIFGAGSDLQIYHDGSHSYIKDTATGNLRIDGTDIQIRSDTGANMAAFVSGAEVQLYHNNQKKLDTTATGIDVTGTVTADGLTVDGSATIQATSSPAISVIDTTNNAEARLQAFNNTATVGTQSNHSFSIETNDTNRALFSADGDISFYEDTGTTPKLVWDASAESLGIGTSTVNRKLEVAGNNNAGSRANFIRITDTDTSATAANPQGGIEFYTSDTGNENVTASIVNLYAGSGAGSELTFNTAPNGASGVSERMRIDSSGKVGIGTDSPAELLHVYTTGNSNAIVKIERETGNTATLTSGASGGFSIDSDNTNGGNAITRFTQNGTEAMRIDASGAVIVNNSGGDAQIYLGGSSGTSRMYLARSGTDALLWNVDGGAMRFGTNNAEAMRISGGNLLVGTTDTSPFDSSTEQGTVISDGQAQIAGTSTPLYLNRQASDGNLVDFRKDGAPVGSIGVDNNDNFYIGASTSGHSGFYFGNTNVAPMAAGTRVDNTIDLGTSDNRFKNLYLSNNISLSNASTSAFLQVSSDVLQFGTSSNDPVVFYANNAEAMRIDASGNVGINGASGGATLQVNQATASYIDIKSDNALRMRMYGDSNQAILVSEGVPLIFKYGSTEAMRIANTGQVLVGSSTSPASGEVKQTLVRGGSSYLEFQNTSTNTGSTIGTSGENLIVYTNSGALGSEVYTERMRIDASGSVGIGTTTMNGGLNLGNFRGTASAPSFSGTNGDGFVFDYYNDTNPYGRHGSIAVIGAGTATADMSFWTDSGSAVTEAMRIDANGSVGIGVVPLAHHYKSLEIGNAGSQITGRTPADTYFMSGLYWSSNSTIKYAVSSVPVGYYSITNGVHSWHNSAAGTAGNDATINTAMTLDASGFLNVGATGTAGTVVFNRSSDGNGAGAISVVGDDFVLNTGFASANMIFKNVTSESMRLDTSGNLLVGVTSISDATSRTYGNAFSGTSANPNWKSWGSGTHTNAQFRNATNVVGTIVTTSTTTTYNTSSDQRLKENIADAPSASDDIDAIQVRSFDWKADGSHQKYGMVAQELQVVAPEAVAAPEDPEEMMGVDYSKLVPMLIKEIQSLRARVAQLES